MGIDCFKPRVLHHRRETVHVSAIDDRRVTSRRQSLFELSVRLQVASIVDV